MDNSLKISWIFGTTAIAAHLTFVTTILLVFAYMYSYINFSVMGFFEPLVTTAFIISRITFIVSTTALTRHKKQPLWIGFLLGLFGQIGLTVTMLIPRRYV